MNLIRSVLYLYLQRPRGTSESGQTMVEYAVVLTLIGAATVAGFTAVQGGIGGLISDATNAF